MTTDQKIQLMTKQLEKMGVSQIPLNNRLDTIQAACCSVFGLSHAELLSRTRTQHISFARMASMYICRISVPQPSLEVIGKTHGGKDHGTVMHAIKRVGEMREYDKDFLHKYNLVIELLKSTPDL